MDTLSAFIVVALIQAPFLGFVTAEMFRFRGPNALRLSHFAAAAFSFCLGLVFFGTTYGVMAGAAFAIPSAVVCALIANWIIVGVNRQLALAPKVAEFALRNYDRLKPTSKGLGTVGLYAVLEEDKFSEEGRELIEHMIRRMPDIGRVTDTVIAGVGMGGMGHAGPVPIPVYAADQNDLRSYPARLREKYARFVEPPASGS